MQRCICLKQMIRRVCVYKKFAVSSHKHFFSFLFCLFWNTFNFTGDDKALSVWIFPTATSPLGGCYRWETRVVLSSRQKPVRDVQVGLFTVRWARIIWRKNRGSPITPIIIFHFISNEKKKKLFHGLGRMLTVACTFSSANENYSAFGNKSVAHGLPFFWYKKNVQIR